ncbi:ABC transporter substrate-binding protein, partial [Alphaproteobacteria bacterium]|nr:ABC transporter substrate-binding protein [Alphaproteobacteria bacterium]
ENSKNIIIKKTFQKKSPSGIEGIILNSRQFPFKDRNVRKAISIIFPYTFINEILNHGLLQKTYGPWDNSDLAATLMPSKTTNKILKKYKDIISIKALDKINKKELKEREAYRQSLSILKKSGWQLINNKMTHTDTKEILNFEVITNQNRMQRLLLVWKDKLKKIGINLSIKILDSSQFQNRLQSFDFNAIIFEYYMSLSPGNEQSIYWGSWASDQQGSRNYAGIKHPAIDEVINKISNAKNRSELIEYTKTLDRLLRAGHWIIPLYHDPLHRIAFKSGFQIPDELPLYGFNPWSTWKK